MKISVTAQDIAVGIKDELGNSPIALAIKRATGRKYVSVYGDAAVINCTAVYLPREAREFMRHGWIGFPELRPFEFELDYQEQE